MYSAIFFNKMGIFHTLAGVIFMQCNFSVNSINPCAKMCFRIAKLLSFCLNNLKANSENYNSTSYLVSMIEEIDCSRKNLELPLKL